MLKEIDRQEAVKSFSELLQKDESNLDLGIVNLCNSYGRLLAIGIIAEVLGLERKEAVKIMVKSLSKTGLALWQKK